MCGDGLGLVMCLKPLSLSLSLSSFYRYLEISREKELTNLVKEGVDTLLMYLYRALNRVHDMEKLASSENNCIVVCATFLYACMRYYTFIL